MERGLGVWKTDEKSPSNADEEESKCGECGKEFERPLAATNTSGGTIKTYHACPHCLSEIAEKPRFEETKSEGPALRFGEPKKPSVKLEEGSNCLHSLGFLKSRPKNTAIPEECLTCERMIECMVH